MDNLGPAVPPSNPDQPSSSAPGGETVILCDVLGRDRSINIFAGFTRDIDTVNKRLSDETLNTTVLAPLNSAIMALPRKPWQDPEDYRVLGADAYEGESGEQRAHRNLRRFVEAHAVPASPWAEGEKVETLAGGQVWWESKDGGKVVSSYISSGKRNRIDMFVDTTRQYRSQQRCKQGCKWRGVDLENCSELRLTGMMIIDDS